jgi:hypothetical protein
MGKQPGAYGARTRHLPCQNGALIISLDVKRFAAGVPIASLINRH